LIRHTFKKNLIRYLRHNLPSCSNKNNVRLPTICQQSFKLSRGPQIRTHPYVIML